MSVNVTRGSQARRLVRRGSRDDRSPRSATLSAGLSTPTRCERCGAVYARKTWRNRALRIARELQKAYGGLVRYHWEPGDGSLDAVWTWDRGMSDRARR